jgi:iron complex transport system substrate-binding protein
VRLPSLALLLLAVALASLARAAPVGSQVERGADYLATRQQADGGFAEPDGASHPTLTAWAVLGLKAAGRNPAGLRQGGASPGEYLQGKSPLTASDLALRILARDALGEDVSDDADRLSRQRRGDGRIGPLVNSTIWGLIALRAADRPVPSTTVRYLLRRQHPSGGWSWAPRGAPDSNDTAAAIQALRAAGRQGSPIRRGLTYLRRLQNRDGGFALTAGASSDAQSTAWAIQAFVAAGARAPAKAVRYLLGVRQPAGWFRYSRRRAVTPAWVTATALPALAGKPFPLR